jgi:hypothetical protein
MCKEDVDKILMINWYLTICKKSKPNCPKADLVKKYLGRKLKKFLNPVV